MTSIRTKGLPGKPNITGDYNRVAKKRTMHDISIDYEKLVAVEDRFDPPDGPHS